jgi:hypothetical protein
MNKVLFTLLAVLIITGVTYTSATACCFTNKDVHNNTGAPAWDFKIILAGDRIVRGHYDGYPWDYRFRKFNSYRICGTTTVLRWTDPVDPSGAPGPIPHCSWVHIGYWLDKPARVLLACWTDIYGRCVCTTRVRQPGHNVIYIDWANRDVVLRLNNDLIDPIDEPIPVSNVSYAILDETLPLQELNAHNEALGELLQPLDPNSPDDVIDPCTALDLQIPEPIEPGQVLVYRFEVRDESSGELQFVDFGQHEMQRPMPQLAGDVDQDLYVNWRDIGVVADDWLRCSNPEDPACMPEVPDP